ncbi:hypothetical protein AALH30_02950 [Blautia pseudococcoides]
MLRQRVPVCRQESGKEVGPPLAGSKEEGEYPYTYRLAGPTCLVGE